MSKHLTIEEITPYLPYDLIYLEVDENKLCLARNISVNNFIAYDDNFEAKSSLKSIKPILFPLSCFDTQITVNGNTFIPLKEILRNSCFAVDKMTEKEWRKYKESVLSCISYEDAKSLFQWKIDLFNLIDQGKAISVFDLESNPYEK